MDSHVPSRVIAACLGGVLALALSLTSGASASPAPATAVPSTIYSSATTTRHVVALTFDDGPSVYTPQVLAILRRDHVPATFFDIGYEVAGYPKYVKAELAQGDLVGDHTYTHPDLVQLSADQVRGQLLETKQAIHTASGYWPHWFRPPYGSVNSQVTTIAASLGLRTVLWSVDPQDWALPGTQAIVDRIISAARPGSVILMHDGGGNRSETVAALPTVIRILASRGYHFETLDQLFGLAPSVLCPSHPARLFSARGVHAETGHAIYQSWLKLLCRGADLGPATSAEYQPRPGVEAQDFRATSHQIEWIRSTGRTHVIIRWDWAAAVFSRDGIQPRWGHPITRAWMGLFLDDQNRGPALTKARWLNHRIRQRFLHGTAVKQPDGTVVWHLRPS